uniref:Uncharacterized protein n=1 Tax=Arundo donax TaxID=35708 RepID=A0A0A9A082_ARUDO
MPEIFKNFNSLKLPMETGRSAIVHALKSSTRKNSAFAKNVRLI